MFLVKDFFCFGQKFFLGDIQKNAVGDMSFGIFLGCTDIKDLHVFFAENLGEDLGIYACRLRDFCLASAKSQQENHDTVFHIGE